MTTAVHSSEEAAQRLAALRTWRWSALAAGAVIAGQRRVSRHEVAPLLLNRVDAVRAELLAVAADLEDGPLDARTIAEITGLITDGAHSPLLNAAVPESELGVALRRIRFRIASARIGGDHPWPAC